MLRSSRLPAVLLAAGTLVWACTGAGASPVVVSPAASSPAASPTATAGPISGGLLDRILKAGKIVVSTDPAYPPQSELKKDGTYQGFDIDVANEVGRRLGVTVEYATPDWTAITAGGWGGRWDMSVGSMTITPDRAKVLDFSPPYYFTPAQ